MMIFSSQKKDRPARGAILVGRQSKYRRAAMKNALAESGSPSQSPGFCRHCGSFDIDTRSKGPHLGIYCASCGRWLCLGTARRPLEKMPFGKHAGVPIADLPHDYLEWILENLKLRGSLLRALETEYERRGRHAA